MNRRSMVHLLGPVASLLTVVLAACGGGDAAPPESAENASTSMGGAAPADAASNNWIEYTVGGDATVSGRDTDVVLCSGLSDGFSLAARGEWYVDIETGGRGAGEYAAEFVVVAPRALSELYDDDAGTDDRFRGDGTVALATGGRDQLGLQLIRAEFAATGLRSGSGHTIDVEGTASCSGMSG